MYSGRALILIVTVALVASLSLPVAVKITVPGAIAVTLPLASTLYDSIWFEGGATRTGTKFIDWLEN